MSAEIRQRFGDGARVMYHDTSNPDVLRDHRDVVARIQDQGLIYPVTFIDGEPVYDGAVSYPAILRAVQTRLAGTVHS